MLGRRYVLSSDSVGVASSALTENPAAVAGRGGEPRAVEAAEALCSSVERISRVPTLYPLLRSATIGTLPAAAAAPAPPNMRDGEERPGVLHAGVTQIVTLLAY